MSNVRTVTTYNFDELSDSAKEKAIENLRYSEGYLMYDWWEFTYEGFKESLALLGFDVDLENTFFSGFYHQRQGAAFTASYEYKKGWKEAVKDFCGGRITRTVNRYWR